MPPARLGALMALIYILILVGLSKGMPDQDLILPYVMINILLLLISIALGLFYAKKRSGYEETSFLDDVKSALQGGMVYTVIVAGYLWVHYKYVDAEFLQNRVDTVMEQVDADLADPDRLEEIREQRPEFRLKSREELRELQLKENQDRYSAWKTSMMGLMGMVLLSFFYSLIVTLIFRKLLFR